jgi:cytochrome c556
MKKIITLAALITLSIGSSIALANTVNSDKQAQTAVQFRQAILQLVRSNMGPMGAMAKGDIPYNADVMELNSLRIEQLGLMMEDYFVADTRAFDVDTGALDAIWDNQADFNQKAQDMVNATINVREVASARTEDDYRKAIGALGATCKACHDDYKKD